MVRGRATTYFDKKQLNRDELLIESYMRSIDMPEWYRGLSQFQLEAAFSLITSLRDDLEQDTSYRVRNILNTIGLRPILTKANVRFVMKLSRGSDLAFLWFIKEIFYKSEGPGYNLNEQLLLTCIANLDLLFTIRGLDSILPPEQKVKKRSNIPNNPFQYIDKQLKPLAKQKSQQQQKQEKQRRQQQQRQQRGERHPNSSPVRASQQQQRHRRSLSTIKKIYKLPYLNSIKKPRPYGKSLSAQPPDYMLHLKFLDDYKDPNYVIPNAHNRWFADYQINIGRMAAANIVNENLDTIFKPNIVNDNLNAIKPIIPKVGSAIFDANIFKHLKLPNKNEAKFKGKQLCMHHQVLEELEHNLEQELQVIAREKCLKYFDMETVKKEERLARLRKQIESDVNMHMKRFKELTKKSQSQLLLMPKDNLEKCSICSINSEIRMKSSNFCGDKENKAKPKHRYVITECGLERQELKKPSNVQRKPLKEWVGNNGNKMSSCGQNRKVPSETEIIGDCLKNNKQWKSSKEQIFIIPSKENLPSSRTQRQRHHHPSCSCASSHSSRTSYSYEDCSSHEYMRNYNYGHPDEPDSECSCCAYFNAPKKHQPFKFDYRKIFNVKTPYDEANLKKMFATAIDRDDSDRDVDEKEEREGQRYKRKRCPSKESVNKAINEYTAKTFKANLHKYNEMNDEHLAEMEMRADVDSKKQKYYDPNDQELMHRMLEDGLKTLATDTRYVLPTLPDAHKIPILRYWIYQRYGKVYTVKELVQIFKKSLELFRALNKAIIHDRLPTSDLIGRAVYTDYSCRSYLLRKSDRVRDLFYKSIETSIMEQARRLFMAMSPYLCTGRPQNKTIFAYLPARPNDIHHFHVWSCKANKRKSKKLLSTSHNRKN